MIPRGSADGAISTAPVRTGPGAHGISYKVGTYSFPGVKRPGRVGKYPPQLSPEVKNKRVELCQYSRTVPSWPAVRQTLYFILSCLGACRMRKAATNLPRLRVCPSAI